MDQLMTRRLLLSLSLPLAALLCVVSGVGLFYPEIYAAASPNWFFQTIGQDGVNLFLIVPVLLFSSLYSVSGNRLPFAIWAGTNIYIAYTFVIYALDVKFNSLFLLYCFILGLSSFSTAIFLYKTAKDNHRVEVTSFVRKMIGYFFIAVSIMFYFTWLSDVIPAIVNGGIPAGIEGTGLITNPVHVLDLSVILPLVLVVGMLTLRGNSFALSLAAPLLTFFILMDITIAALTIVLFRNAIEQSYSVAIVMGVHAILSIGAIILLWRNIDFSLNGRLWNWN